MAATSSQLMNLKPQSRGFIRLAPFQDVQSGDDVSMSV